MFVSDHGNNNADNFSSRSTTRKSSILNINQDNNYVSRLQNATTNVMGRISGLGRGSIGGIGGIANKFLNNL